MLRLISVIILLAPSLAVAGEFPTHDTYEACGNLKQPSDIETCVHEENIHARYVGAVWNSISEDEQIKALKIADAAGYYSHHWFGDLAHFLESRLRKE